MKGILDKNNIYCKTDLVIQLKKIKKCWKR